MNKAVLWIALTLLGLFIYSVPALLREDYLLKAFEKWWPELQGTLMQFPQGQEIRRRKGGAFRKACLLRFWLVGYPRSQQDQKENPLQASQSNKQIPPRSYIHPSTIRRIEDS